MRGRKISALKRERLLKGLYQAELSSQTGIPQAYISGFETGRLRPKEKEIAILAKTFGVKPEKIFPPKDK